VETNVSELLDKALLGRRLRLMQRVAEQAAALRLPLYIVGGFPRDLLLGRPSMDYDLVVEGNAVALARRLFKAHGGKVTSHSRFGTAKWALPEGFAADDSEGDSADMSTLPASLDLISARAETYGSPAALPTVKPGTIRDDLQRRDFTINAMAIRLDGERRGELLDLMMGQEDLRRGLIRVLHSQSFVDDPTRIYRAVRYEKRFGFSIVGPDLQMMHVAKPIVDRLSAQRIRRELDLVLEEPHAGMILARMADLDLLRQVHPLLPWNSGIQARLHLARSQRPGRPAEYGGRHQQQSRSWPRFGWLLWLMSLPEVDIRTVHRRLSFSASLLKSLLASSELYADLNLLAGLRPSQCVERLEVLPVEAVQAVALGAPEGAPKRALQSFLGPWSRIKPHTTARDLLQRGLRPGPRYAQILRDLRNAWIDAEVASEEDELQMLDGLLDAGSGASGVS